MRGVFAAIAAVAIASSANAGNREGLAIQWKLRALGYDVGTPDGLVGPATKRAISEATNDFGFQPTVNGFVDFFATKAIRESKPLADEEALEAVEKAVSGLFRDPSSAQFRNVRVMGSGMICGQVNGKNGYGGYAGFQDFQATAMKFPGAGWFVIPSIDLGPVLCPLDTNIGDI